MTEVHPTEETHFDFGDPVELLEAWEREQDRKAERDTKNAERGGKKR